jgi:hypothetical protein
MTQHLLVSAILHRCQFGTHPYTDDSVVGQNQFVASVPAGAMSAITGSADGCPILWENKCAF